MTHVQIMFGTESGNAEMVADELADTLASHGFVVTATEMSEFDTSELEQTAIIIVITSTYGEGELPASALPLHDALVTGKPELGSLRFAAFGLGDSSYEHFNNGVRTLAATLTALGATQIGECGIHDALSGLDAVDVSTEWAAGVVPELRIANDA